MTGRILVTRPQAQAGPLIVALQSQGYEPVAFPLMEIVIYDEQQHPGQCLLIRRCIDNLAGYQHVICISTNAADAAWQWIGRCGLTLPAGQHWYAIGEATAGVLRKHLPCVEQAGSATGSSIDRAMDSDSLLQHSNLQQLENCKILIFRGNGGREYLKQQLEQRGAEVDYCEVYERRRVAHGEGRLRQILLQGIDFLTATSTETIQLLLDQAMIDGVKGEVVRLPVVVPGRRVGDFARERGFRHVIESGNAGLPSMLEVISQHTINKNKQDET